MANAKAALSLAGQNAKKLLEQAEADLKEVKEENRRLRQEDTRNQASSARRSLKNELRRTRKDLQEQTEKFERLEAELAESRDERKAVQVKLEAAFVATGAQGSFNTNAVTGAFAQKLRELQQKLKETKQENQRLRDKLEEAEPDSGWSTITTEELKREQNNCREIISEQVHQRNV